MTDYAYEKARNRLIPTAARHADSQHGPIAPEKGSEKEAWYGKWNRSFHTEMDRLAKEYDLN